MDEVSAWQADKSSPRSGSLAFLALMTAEGDGSPQLLPMPGIDTPRAVHELLSSPTTAPEVISPLTAWIGNSTKDPAAYTQLRDLLLPAPRGHNMFEAGMKLLQELQGLSTTDGVSVAAPKWSTDSTDTNHPHVAAPAQMDVASSANVLVATVIR
ncbi:hypothetical protein [Streptomyces sp. NBC_01012]|uniref:hypothetical protein n=1 Tax=Streptomyces sp. NBC_01012 TaxID=2903717 RepID=UPI00386BDDDF|nr:hypothetical protein OG623_03865 [Streptomyces sp. NBC_01012]